MGVRYNWVKSSHPRHFDNSTQFYNINNQSGILFCAPSYSSKNGPSIMLKMPWIRNCDNIDTSPMDRYTDKISPFNLCTSCCPVLTFQSRARASLTVAVPGQDFVPSLLSCRVIFSLFHYFFQSMMPRGLYGRRAEESSSFSISLGPYISKILTCL